jgi:hypothetical protein
VEGRCCLCCPEDEWQQPAAAGQTPMQNTYKVFSHRVQMTTVG